MLGIHHSPSKTAASTTVHPSLPHPLSHPTHSHPTLQISRLTTTPLHTSSTPLWASHPLRTTDPLQQPYTDPRLPHVESRTAPASARDGHTQQRRPHTCMKPGPPHTQYRSRTVTYRHAYPNRLTSPPTNHAPLIPGGSEFFDAVRLVVASPRYLE